MKTEEPAVTATKKVKPYCTCGKNSKDPSREFCCSSEFYQSRCQCFGKGQGCRNCGCKNCNNPNGKQPLKPVVKHSRKRQSSQLPTRRTGNVTFLTNSGEKANRGSWFDVETLLLYHLMESIQDIVSLKERFNEEAKKLQRNHFQIDFKTCSEIEAKITYS